MPSCVLSAIFDPELCKQLQSEKRVHGTHSSVLLGWVNDVWRSLQYSIKELTRTTTRQLAIRSHALKL